VAGLNLYQSASLWTGNRVTAGFDLQGIGGKAWNDYEAMLGSAAAGRNTVLADTAMTEVAAYVDVRQELGSIATAEAGIRVDHHSVAGTEWVPQFGLSFHLPLSAELKLTAGKGFRNPTLTNLFMFRPANAELRAERIWNYEAALSGRLLDGRLTYGINVYLLKGDNLIQTVAGHNQNTGAVENRGIELQAACRISRHWQANANYSAIHKKYDIVAVPHRKLYAEGNYVGERFSASLGVEWVNHLTTQVASDSAERAENSYVLVSARAGYRLCRCVHLFARGENLLAQRYEVNYGYPMPRATFMGGVHLSF